MKKATILAAELLAAVIICSSCSSKYKVGEIRYPFSWNLWISYGNPNKADADKDEIMDLILSAPPSMTGGKSNRQQVISAGGNHHPRTTRIYYE